MKFLFSIALIFLFYACYEKPTFSYSEPENLLSEEKMVKVIEDVTFVESAYTSKYSQVSRFNHLMQEAIDSVFSSNDIDREAFESSMDYYANHQQDLIEIYRKVKANLLKKQQQVQSSSSKEEH